MGEIGIQHHLGGYDEGCISDGGLWMWKRRNSTCGSLKLYLSGLTRTIFWLSSQSHCVVRLVSSHAFFTICLQENCSINPKAEGIPRGRIMFR